MTTGSFSFGSIGAGIASAKNWSGTDGRYVGSPPQLKWNTYGMRHRTHKINGSLDAHMGAWNQASVYRISTGAWIGTFTDPDFTSWCHDSNTPYWTTSSASSIFSNMWSTDAEYRVLQKLLRNVKGHDYNIGVSLAEVDKLKDTVLGAIKNIGYGADDLLHRRYAKFARRFGASPPHKNRVKKLDRSDVSGRFLEMRYAWLPAVQDVYESAKAFEEISRNRRGKRFTASAHVTQILTKSDGTWLKNWPNKVRRANRKYVIELYESMSAIRQLGLYNPASILWERIPWSFVLDWFIPIGTYLELIGQIPSLNGRFLRIDSLRSTVVGTPTGIGSSTGSGNRAVGPGSVDAKNFWLSRSILGSLTGPRPSLKGQGAVAGRRVQNAIALSHQLFEKALKKRH